MQDNVQTQVDAWRLQVKKGMLELAVLALLHARPSYGLELLERLNASGLDVRDGTIYPLLSRLRMEKKVNTKWVDEAAGHAHKYYTLTEKGVQILEGMLAAWREHKSAMERAIGKSK
jgi:PadR family transcriptional regulator, regulatory protein PadR